ncbi:hypothetical protein MTR67_051072 [Solanum verrucosum]|uniref:Uncharacterized protein n=1 Tax=Solanum verrucosum TaxID=315347 RepID=A0AAF0V465_SOLVR|nr:hypothetical protein MTR67_051072 [Solanum verrucosum]
MPVKWWSFQLLDVTLKERNWRCFKHKYNHIHRLSISHLSARRPSSLKFRPAAARCSVLAECSQQASRFSLATAQCSLASHASKIPFGLQIHIVISCYSIEAGLAVVICSTYKSFVQGTGRMAGKAVKSVAKAVGEYQYPWQEKLVKYKDELSKGVWGYWELGAWKPLGISARHRARLRKEVVLAGQDWPYDPARKEMRTKQKGHKCDRISAEKRAKTAELMQKMPEMLADYRKRKWERKMKAEEDAARKSLQE